MAIKANASATGGGEFKQYIGVGSFRVLGVNPTKDQLSQFYGRDMTKDPQYLFDKEDKEGKAYKFLRVSFMIQADDPESIEEGNKISKETNACLTEPLKTTVNFLLDNRYFFNKEKTKIKVIDKYARTAWVTVEQAKNHQIPVYANGPARLDKDYKPLLHGEEELTNFIMNYLCVNPIEVYNKNTGQYITNSHPEDCEGNLYEIQKYFKGDFSELDKYCKMLPTNRVKLLVGVQTDDEGKQHVSVYDRVSLRNGSKNYKTFKDAVDGDKSFGRLQDTVFSDDNAGLIENLHEYNANVKETDLSKPADNPFESNADDLPFGPSSNEDDPFASVA